MVLTGCLSVRLAEAPDLEISNVRIVDGTGREPFVGSILVDEGRITALRPGGAVGSGARTVIDGTGATVLPGLWDMHVHLAEDRRREELLPGFVEWGVTHVRDAGGHIEVLQEWDREIAAGLRVGPRIFSAGRSLTEELVLLHEAALPWPQVVRAATLDAAITLGVAEDRGSIEVGKSADLVLYRSDPFAPPGFVQRPEHVFLQGRRVHPEPASR